MDPRCQNQKTWVKMPYKGYQRVYGCDNKISPFDGRKRRMIWYEKQEVEDMIKRKWERWMQLDEKFVKDERRALSICKMKNQARMYLRMQATMKNWFTCKVT